MTNKPTPVISQHARSLIPHVNMRIRNKVIKKEIFHSSKGNYKVTVTLGLSINMLNYVDLCGEPHAAVQLLV